MRAPSLIQSTSGPRRKKIAAHNFTSVLVTTTTFKRKIAASARRHTTGSVRLQHAKYRVELGIVRVVQHLVHSLSLDFAILPSSHSGSTPLAFTFLSKSFKTFSLVLHSYLHDCWATICAAYGVVNCACTKPAKNCHAADSPEIVDSESEILRSETGKRNHDSTTSSRPSVPVVCCQSPSAGPTFLIAADRVVEIGKRATNAVCKLLLHRNDQIPDYLYCFLESFLFLAHRPMHSSMAEENTFMFIPRM